MQRAGRPFLVGIPATKLVFPEGHKPVAVFGQTAAPFGAVICLLLEGLPSGIRTHGAA
jgi:hypothetical protein